LIPQIEIGTARKQKENIAIFVGQAQTGKQNGEDEMIRHRKPHRFVGRSARALDNEPNTDVRTLKFEENSRWRFCICPWTWDGYKYWIIDDLSDSHI
jgi:hypothetical protein